MNLGTSTEDLAPTYIGRRVLLVCVKRDNVARRDRPPVVALHESMIGILIKEGAAKWPV
jgi:hypothetical protein